MIFGSLYTGFGGLDLGLERAGLSCGWQVENNVYARRVLARHWPDVPKHDDARTFPPGEPEDWNVDLIAGGDPCQGNSQAGAIYRRVHEDLGVHFLRIVDAIRPRLVLRENPSATRKDALWPWGRFRDCLESLGYAVLPFRLRSCCLGGDHRRERMFLLASLPDPDGDGLERFHRAWQQAGHAGGEAGGPLPGAGSRGHDLPAPRICRGSDGIPHRVERLRGLGNAVDPFSAERIGRVILEAAS